MNFVVSFLSVKDAERFTLDLAEFDAKYLSKDLRNHFRPGRAADYFRAYATFGLIEKYGYYPVAGLSFMAGVFEAVAEVHIRSLNSTSPFMKLCGEISRSLCKDLLHKMNMDQSESTSLTLFFLKLAYQNRPAL